MNNLFHVIKDPVHGTMQFTGTEDKWVKPFIDSPNFQRLRHIKQLGLGDFIFPGAVHSRFNHSLGCCYVGSQIAHKIGLKEEERQLVMIACLIHDIGHGPFSHAFEGIFQDKLIRHEDWTPYFLADYNNQAFFETYNALNKNYPLEKEKFNTIGNMIMHKPVAKRVLADIVSSQLDADRLDYLLRDNHFCGVRYGEFDFRWMLHCMTIVKKSDHSERLGITHKGIGVVEHYLMARRLMMRNIYHSQKKLAFEALLVEWLVYLAASLEHSNHDSIRATRLGQFLIAANRFNQELASHKENTQAKREFLENNYKNYKELCDYDVFALLKFFADINDESEVAKLATRLHHRHMPKIVRLDHLDLKIAHEQLQQFKLKHKNKYQNWQLSITQTPHRSYSDGDDPILVINEQGAIQPIGNFSLMLNAISDKLEHIAFLCIDKFIAEDKEVMGLINDVQAIPA